MGTETVIKGWAGGRPIDYIPTFGGDGGSAS